MVTLNICHVNSSKTNCLKHIDSLVIFQRKALPFAACLVSLMYLVHCYVVLAQKYEKERYFRFSKIRCWKTLASQKVNRPGPVKIPFKLSLFLHWQCDRAYNLIVLWSFHHGMARIGRDLKDHLVQQCMSAMSWEPTCGCGGRVLHY